MRLLPFPARRGQKRHASSRRGLAHLALGVLLLWYPVAAVAGQISVFAAASLKTAMDEAAGDYETTSGAAVTLSYGGSPMLARQIGLGAPADVFISANPGWMDHLQTEGLILAEERFDLLTNSLVLVAHGENADPVDIAQPSALGRLLGNGRLAMALAEAVPAGIYGKAALTSLGQWSDAAPRTAQTANVRMALALVASGEAPFGIVYATDAAASNAVSVVYRFAPGSHPPIVYPAAAVKGRNAPAATAFLAYLRSPKAQEIFERHGFGVIPE